jgi:hypothetical protein
VLLRYGQEKFVKSLTVVNRYIGSKLQHGQKFAAAKLRTFTNRKIGFISRVPSFKAFEGAILKI